jgi:hypothetical protein
MLEGKKEPVNLDEMLSYRFGDGTSFPTSYIEFARQYGFGLTCGEFLIYIPMGGYCDSFFSQSCAIKGTYSDVLGNPNDVWFDIEPDVDFERLKRLIPFASSDNGNYLFWDSARTVPNEMDIYITDFRGLGFVKAASSLYELIEKMTDPKQFKEVFPLFYQEELPATFMPFQKHED